MLARLRQWLRGPDPDIDRLIATNVARPKPEMARVDWRKVDAAGERRWQQVQRGQQLRRHRRTEVLTVVDRRPRWSED